MTLRAAAIALAVLLAPLAATAQGLRPATPVPPARIEAGPQPADFIVAVVNSEPITNNDVRARMVRFAQQLAEQGQQPPPREEFARQVLERLINERAQIQFARENGVRIDDALVDQAEQHVARTNQVTVAEMRRRVLASGSSVAAFRNELREQLVLQRLREREFDNKGRVSELEIDQYLRDQEAAARDPNNVEFNLGHILIGVPENASIEQTTQLAARAQQVLARARAGEDLVKLGQEFPDGRDFGATGAPVGARPLDRLPPLFVQAVQGVPEGGVANIVRSAAGFHIIKVYERRSGSLAQQTVVQNHARHILIRPGPNMTETQAVARLGDFKRRIQAGQADFAQLAREHSQDASGRNGGDLGWAGPGVFVPEFEEALNTLAPGQMADPVISRFGVHLIQLLERRQSRLSQRELRDVARNILRDKKIDEAYVAWAEDVRGRAFVDFREAPR
ncbi:peptidylprolyl isomerase [Ramlibacter sp. PS4R-6]|uniref:peptidylprolyl isomerase n=1 Tax=Ramlibacter sp. PS4R-6 TaxID=3133438 RepID=UPI0030AE11AE